jgi:hypothetical protein
MRTEIGVALPPPNWSTGLAVTLAPGISAA